MARLPSSRSSSKSFRRVKLLGTLTDENNRIAIPNFCETDPDPFDAIRDF